MWTDDRPSVPCGLCGTPTPMTGTKRCDRCWELESRIYGDPALAQKILDGMKQQPAAPSAEQATGITATELGYALKRATPAQVIEYLEDDVNMRVALSTHFEEQHAQQPAAAHEPCAAVAAIQFALTDPEGMTFLRLWNEGEFDTLRREWPDAIRKVYDGADPLTQQPAADPRSTHRVWRGDDWLPCYCEATDDHRIGSEQPAAVDGPCRMVDGVVTVNGIALDEVVRLGDRYAAAIEKRGMPRAAQVFEALVLIGKHALAAQRQEPTT